MSSGGAEGRRELLDLLGALCNGTISPDEHRRLEELLRADAANRRVYFDYLDLHLGLRQVHLARRDAEAAADVARAAAAGPPSAPDATAAARRRRQILVRATALAAAAGVAIFLWAALREGAGGAIAVVTQSARAQLYDKRDTLPPGSALVLGRDYALRGGQLELRFRNGVETIIEGPAVFAIKDVTHIALKAGRCSVHVSEQGKGFVVETPLTRIVDLGTRFAVGVDEGGETEVHVVEGAADVYSKPSTSSPSAPASKPAPPAPSAPSHLARGDAERYAGDPQVTATRVAYNAARFPLAMPDRVVRYTATSGPHGVEDLTSVTVRRGGRDLTYVVERLIGIDLIHFKGERRGNRHYMATRTDGVDPNGAASSPRLRHDLLDRDRNLNTGIVNPGGSPTPLDHDPVINDPEDPATPNTPGMAIRFREPVLNDVGPDVVMFEYQPVIQPENGDSFHVSPLHFREGLRTFTVARWDLGTFSPEALTLGGFRLHTYDEAVTAFSGLEGTRLRGGANHPVASKALAVALDLESLGYARGETVTGLFIQDVLDGGHQVDPVFIAGLPPVSQR